MRTVIPLVVFFLYPCSAPAIPYTFTKIANTDGRFASFFGPTFGTSINNQGDVAFVAELDAGGQGIFVGNGGPSVGVADTTGEFVRLTRPSINGGGTVAFRAEREGGDGILSASRLRKNGFEA